MANPTIQIALRLPPELHAKLTKLAKSERRSVNGEAVLAIEAHVKGEGKR